MLFKNMERKSLLCYDIHCFLAFLSSNLEKRKNKKKTTTTKTHTLCCIFINCIKFVSFIYFQYLPVLRSHDIDNPTVSIQEIKIKLKQTTKEVTLTLTKELKLDWTTACHMCIIQAIEDVKELKTRISELSEFLIYL